QGHRLRPRDLAAPDGTRDARRTIVARDEHRRRPPLSSRRPAMRRALAALATVALFAGGALAQSDIFDPAAIATRERQQLIDAKQQSAAAMARSALLEKQAAAASSEADRLKKRSAALAARIQSAEADISAGEARVA